MSDDLEAEILDHLIVEFGDAGRRAADFLRSAQALRVVDSGQIPRLPATLAYCLREAMKAIPTSQAEGEGGEWRTVSRRVTAAKSRYLIAQGKPGADEEGALAELLTAIADLDEFHGQGGIHEQRLIAIMLSRTGSLPISAGTGPIREYQELLRKLDGAVHGEVDADLAEQLWRESVATLHRFFMPPEMRRAELDSLAALTSPTDGDLASLLDRLISAQDLQYFLSRIDDPVWLWLLIGSGLLAPPSASAGWPMLSAVDRLAPTYPDEISTFLARLYDMYGRDPQQAWFIGRAAIELGRVGSTLIAPIVKEHPLNSSIAHLGVWASQKAIASDGVVEELADLLLNRHAWEASGACDSLCERLVEGMTAKNWQLRLGLIVFKLRSVDDDELRCFSFDRAGSIAEPSKLADRSRFSFLLRALVAGLQTAGQFSATADLVIAIAGLPQDVMQRFEAWLLANAVDVDNSVRISHIAGAIAARSPTGDDLRLVDMVHTLVSDAHELESWAKALGDPPTVGELTSALRDDSVPANWLRVLDWIGVLPAKTVSLWSTASSILATRYGTPNRARLAARNEPQFGTGHSPIDLDALRAATVPEACHLIAQWRPDGTDWLASARELARALQALVKENPTAWAAQPISTVTTLRQPIYISHFLEGLASAGWPDNGDLQQVLDVLVLVRAAPWAADVLGSDAFDYDPDWRDAIRAGVELVKKLTEQDVEIGDRADEVWAFVAGAARDYSEPSGLMSGARDPRDFAINRSCTRAFDTAISFMAYEFRAKNHVRADALALISESLALPGSDGAHYRAILAPHVGFVRHVAPEWVAARMSLLFGNDAHESLGRLTIDLALKWGRPQTWLLEERRVQVFDAVQRNVHNALEHALVAMLWDVPGYSVDKVIATLRPSASRLSAAGEALARMLRGDGITPEHIASAAGFWRAVLKLETPAALGGFGWFSDVAAMDEDNWTRLTLDTVAITKGRIDWAHRVAERAASGAVDESRLAILNELVRGTADEWDRRRIVETAAEGLKVSSAPQSDAHQRLRTALLERGFF